MTSLNSALTDICEDPKQLLYVSCSYVYPSGAHCTSPVPVYLQPPLCGGHCDIAIMETSKGQPELEGEGASMGEELSTGSREPQNQTMSREGDLSIDSDIHTESNV